ncbi:MAG TPA: glycosyltransferase WbuB, partial [Sneathiellales bacterium]|nr:glycosyltransferase WbuB [Sneathiellales bacterium]
MVTSRRDAGTKPPNGWTESTESGIQVHWYPVTYSNATPFKKRIRAFLKFAFQSTRKAMSLEGDVVFATSTPLTIALPGVFTAWRRRIPMVFEVRDLWPELPIAVGALKGRIPIALARWLERFAYRNATRVVALSQGMKDGVVRIGYHGDHVHVIPNSA